jgi:dTMP kinase
MKKGKFISFEGIDGSGKSSAIQGVKDYLESRGIKTLCLRQPGGSSLGDELRKLLKHHPDNIENLCEVLLLCASFRACYLEKIKPALKEGVWVLTDRFADSTIAYQCGGSGIKQKSVKKLLKQSVPKEPDLTLYYDIKAETALSRVSQRGDLDNFEKRGPKYLEASRKKYLELAKKAKLSKSKEKRFFILNTEKLNKEMTLKESIKFIEKKFKLG